MKNARITMTQDCNEVKVAFYPHTKSLLQDLAAGYNCDGVEIVGCTHIDFDEEVVTKEVICNYAKNAVFFTTIKVLDNPTADEDEWHMEDIVLNVIKDNALTSTLSAEKYKEALEADAKCDTRRSLPPIEFIHTKDLNKGQLEHILF